MLIRLRRVPRPLALLLCVTAVLATAWAFIVPPWQAPDESAHFAYAQALAERHQLPRVSGGKIVSTEQQLALSLSNATQTAASPLTKPEWSRLGYERWRRAERALAGSARRDGGGRNPASTNPPLYYLWELPPYLAASAGDIFDRLYLMRLWSVALLLATVIGAWLLVGEVVGREPTLQLAGAGVAALQPMVVFVSASVSPDALLLATWAFALWLGVRVVKRGFTLATGAALFVTVALAVLTKATSYALVPAALFAVAVGLLRHARAPRNRGLVVAACVAALVAPVGGWIALSRALDRPAVNQVAGATELTDTNVRRFTSYLWQFYLPKLPFQQPTPAIAPLPAYDVWVKTGWGAFGWLEVRLPAAIYPLLAAFTVAALAIGGVAVWRRGGKAGRLALAFLALTAIVLLAGLHWVEYRVIVTQGLAFNQGRYLLPLVPILSAAVAASIGLLRQPARLLSAGVLLSSLFALQLASLAVTTARFYA